MGRESTANTARERERKRDDQPKTKYGKVNKLVGSASEMERKKEKNYVEILTVYRRKAT